MWSCTVLLLPLKGSTCLDLVDNFCTYLEAAELSPDLLTFLTPDVLSVVAALGLTCFKVCVYVELNSKALPRRAFEV